MPASQTDGQDIGSSKPSQSWQVRTTDTIYSNGFFSLRRDKCYNGLDPADARDLFVLEIPDRVSVVPVSEDGRFILIEQYRHGVADWILECPGGTVDDDDTDPAKAAARELLEETGYVPARLMSLGSSAADPSGQTSQIHSYLAVGCRFVSKPVDNAFEPIRVHLVNREELLNLIRNGANFQGASLASLMLALAQSPEAIALIT